MTASCASMHQNSNCCSFAVGTASARLCVIMDTALSAVSILILALALLLKQN